MFCPKRKTRCSDVRRDGCMAGLAEMYNDYIDGKREIRDINMEFNARYVKGDMEKDNGRSCPM